MHVFEKVTVEIVHGDISNFTADVIVNAANDQLVMGGGVAGALRARGGIEIHQEAIKSAPAAIGSVIRTGAGKLNARYVYHAVVIRYSLDGGTAVSDVETVTTKLLRQAEHDGITTMVMPLFGTGVGGLSVADSLDAMLRAIERSAGTISVKLNVLVAVLPEVFDTAKGVFNTFLRQEDRQKEENDIAEDYLRSLDKKR